MSNSSYAFVTFVQRMDASTVKQVGCAEMPCVPRIGEKVRLKCQLNPDSRRKTMWVVTTVLYDVEVTKDGWKLYGSQSSAILYVEPSDECAEIKREGGAFL